MRGKCRFIVCVVVLMGAAPLALSAANPAYAQVPDASVDHLIETVTEAVDPQARAAAAEQLGLLGVEPERVASVLVQELGWDDAPAVRGRAAEALGRIGPATDQVVPRLIEALEWDDQLSVRWRAAEALERIGALNEDVVPALVKSLREDRSPGVRARAAQTLGVIGAKTDEVVPALVLALQQDRHPGVRWQAATALENIAVQLRDASAVESIGALKDALAVLSDYSQPDVQRNADVVRQAIQQLEGQ